MEHYYKKVSILAGRHQKMWLSQRCLGPFRSPHVLRREVLPSLCWRVSLIAMRHHICGNLLERLCRPTGHNQLTDNGLLPSAITRMTNLRFRDYETTDLALGRAWLIW